VWLWWLVVIFLLLMALFTMIPLKLEFYYCRRGHDRRLLLVIRTWFNIKYQLLPGKNPDGQVSLISSGRLVECIRLGLEIWPALKFLLRRTRLCRLEWRTLVGLPDAAHTGMVVGGLWSLKGTVLTVLYRLVSKKSTLPEVAVLPHFTGSSFGLLIHCIFTFRLGHIMVTAVKLACLTGRQGLKRILSFIDSFKG